MGSERCHKLKAGRIGDGQEVPRNGVIYAAKLYGRVKKKVRPEAEKSQRKEVIYNHKSQIVFCIDDP